MNAEQDDPREQEPGSRRLATGSSLACGPLPPRYLDPAHWRRAVMTSDPDLARWRMAARVTLSVTGSAALLWLVSLLLHVPLPVLLPGIMLTMTAAIAVNDPTPRGQRLTMALMPLPAALCLVLGTLLAPHRALSLGTFLVIIFAAVFIRRFGPRGTALGLIGYLSYFFALFFQAPARALPPMIGSIVLAVAVTYLVRFRIVGEQPERLFQRCLDAFQVSLRMELTTLADALACPHWGRAQDRAIERSVRRLNRIALTTEDYLDKAGDRQGLPAFALRRNLFELEIAAERLAATIRFMAGRGLSGATRAEVAHQLKHVRHWLRQPEADPPVLVPDTPEASLAIHGLMDLVQAARSLCEPRSPALAQAPQPPDAGKKRPDGIHPATRQAIQATVATGIAMAVGLAVAPTRWYWAVIGAYIMFIRATTLGETLVRGWQRILGTAVGVMAGVYLAGLMAGHPVVEVLEMVVALFLGFYFLGYSYLWMVVGLTLLLAALYLLLGRYSPELMVQRLELTLVGCITGGIVAAVVLPAPTNVKVRTTLIEALRDLADLVEASLAHRSAPGSVEQTRHLDRKLRDLREAAKPLTGRFLGMGSRRLHRAFHYLAAAVTFTRHLVITSERLPETPPGLLEVIGCHVVDNIRAIATDLGDRKAIRPLEDSAECNEALKADIEAALAVVRQTVYWLEQLDEAVVGLGRTLDGRLR